MQNTYFSRLHCFYHSAISSFPPHQVLFEEESASYYGHSLALPMHLTGPPFESLVKVLFKIYIRLNRAPTFWLQLDFSCASHVQCTRNLLNQDISSTHLDAIKLVSQHYESSWALRSMSILQLHRPQAVKSDTGVPYCLFADGQFQNSREISLSGWMKRVLFLCS